jgi:hypothetical protein
VKPPLPHPESTADVDLELVRARRPIRQPGEGSDLMAVSPVDKELPWDEDTRAVAQAVVQHRPEATATEAYYYMIMQHLAQVLWRLGAGHRALKALGMVLSDSIRDVREGIADASATTRRQR